MILFYRYLAQLYNIVQGTLQIELYLPSTPYKALPSHDIAAEGAPYLLMGWCQVRKTYQRS